MDDGTVAEFGKKLPTWDYDLIQAARDAAPKPLSMAELGEVSYQNLKDRAKDKGIDLKDLAKSIGMTPKQLRKGVKEGRQFQRKPGAFDAMCRQLGFQPSEARTVLGGIYEARARGERIDTRMSVNEKLQRMHAIYQKIVDPSKRYAAEAAIDGLWDFLNKLADSQG